MQRLPVHKRWSSILQCTVDTCKSFRWWWLGPSLPASSPSGGARNVMERHGRAGSLIMTPLALMQRGRPQHAKEPETRTRRNNRPSGACNGKGKPGAMGRGHSRNIPVPSIQRSFEIVHRLGHLRQRDPPYPVSVESAATNSTERADLFYCCGALAKPLGLL